MVQGIEPAKGLRGAPAKWTRRQYVKREITKPIRGRRRKGAEGEDPLEQRAAAVDGSILERIIFKRLTVLVGPADVGFIYKRQVGSAPGVNARTFIGGIEIDFLILQRPAGKAAALEILGAHWHGPADEYADQERALIILAQGYDYVEIWEYEIMLGDEYLDQRLTDLLGLQGRYLDDNRVVPGIGEISR